MLLGLVYPLNIVHELGHAFVCDVYGYNYSITLSLFDKSNVICSGNELNKVIYGGAGGLAVMIVALSVLLIPYIRNNIGIRIGFVSISVMSFANAMLEGFFFKFYNNNISLLEILFLLILIIVFSTQWLLLIKSKN